VFVHISAVERAGLSTLNEGQQIEYEIEENRGKTSAVNLKVKRLLEMQIADAWRWMKRRNL
jgi:'Cold-shock' DNA-binding domain